MSGNWSWEVAFSFAAGAFMAWTGFRALQHREITVDQENSDPVQYTAERTPVRFWLAALLPLVVGTILLGRFFWLVWR